MEALLELVAASFLRHGIECPPAASKVVNGQTAAPVSSERTQAIANEPILPTALLEHNYRKQSETDPAL